MDKNANPLISIIIPVYNVEKYLDKCLKSVINQVYENVEIILVDDGSTDASGKIADDYRGKDDRIIVFHIRNKGLSAARNMALDLAHGDYIMFVDSDDWVEPDFCRIALDTAIKQNADIVCFGYQQVNSNGEKLCQKATNNPRMIKSEEGIRELIIKNDVIYNLAWNKIYDKNVLKSVRFPESQRSYEDQGFTYLAFHNAAKIYVDNHILYDYLQRDDSLSANWDKPEALKCRFEIWIERLDFIQKNYPNLEDVQMRQIGEECFKGIRLLSKEKEYKETRKAMIHFLKNHKQKILHLFPLKAFLYFYLTPLFYLYYFVRS